MVDLYKSLLFPTHCNPNFYELVVEEFDEGKLGSKMEIIS
jgi:hypothetical protein